MLELEPGVAIVTAGAVGLPFSIPHELAPYAMVNVLALAFCFLMLLAGSK